MLMIICVHQSRLFIQFGRMWRVIFVLLFSGCISVSFIYAGFFILY